MKMESLTPECYSILQRYHNRYSLFYDMFIPELETDYDFPWNDILWNP